MGLREIGYQDDYRSGVEDLLMDFFRPSLRCARQYWRAVGYFSSSSLESLGAPLGDFVLNNGMIRLITSVELSQVDLEAIKEGSSKLDVCAERLEWIIEREFSDGIGEGTTRLIRLLQLDRLEIKIATPKIGSGIYHEKIGIFLDGDDFVAFTGSSNESRNAFEHNRECIDVYPSWRSSRRAHRKLDHFKNVWEGSDPGVDVFTLPMAIKNRLVRLRTAQGSTVNARVQEQDKWRHQHEAMTAFLAAERGILDMATGTGKTRTAFGILEHLFSNNVVDTAVITMDGTDLLNQWWKQLIQHRNAFRPGLRLLRDYDEHKDLEEFVLNPSNSVFLVSRQPGPRRAPLAAALRRLNREMATRTILVHDEVHRLGSAGNIAALSELSERARFRLGLSATPERDYDAEGNEFIEHHIGPTIFTFELDDAIRRGILAPFDYFPIPYDMDERDRERIRKVYAKQAARAREGKPMTKAEVWIDLSKVHKTSLAKLPPFHQYIKQNAELLDRCIIFVETREYGEEVLEIVHSLRPDFHTYFSGEQEKTLKKFARGDLNCLITCHRLSEGIDIQSLNSVILFSSARARLETVQRIGRCLRTDPNNPRKIANIVDFVRNPTEDQNSNADAERCSWLTDLSRIR
ncbi:DEAD/DEAH box helicase family protein [Sphaerisporangium sp. NPDC049003]|uniref:DEAD/DEAH box helicase family protein n=1 Tax=Sphaerisporangium sp. NPDC049003 TaxID=3364517 RepID=UPI003722192B